MTTYKYMKERWKTHPEQYEKHKQACAKWRKNHKIHTQNYWKTYYKNKREKLKLLRLNWRRNRRIKILELLGNKCSNPYNIDHSSFEQNSNYIKCLQIDHIHGGGAKEITRMNRDSYNKMVYEKIKLDSKDYQLLCANCNWIKRYENKEI